MSSLSTSLADKIAIVTGASRGIGAAIALRLAEEGAKVVVNYSSSPEAASEVVQNIKAAEKGSKDALAVKADVSTVEGGKSLIDETIKHYGRLDILVLNAAVNQRQVLAGVNEEEYDYQMNLNVKVPLFMTQAAVKHFPPSGGRVIFIGSIQTGYSGVAADFLVYPMSKGAVNQMTRLLAKDLGSKLITVNGVLPGATDTELFRQGKSEELLKQIAAQTPSNHIGTPEEVSPIVAFLASPAAQWINGQSIMVNGGFVV